MMCGLGSMYFLGGRDPHRSRLCDVKAQSGCICNSGIEDVAVVGKGAGTRANGDASCVYVWGMSYV